MSQTSQQQLAQAVHSSGLRLVLAVTGGGSGAISTLLSVPGASRSILSATVPYVAEALTEWLGGRPDESCSPRTARAMAMAAFLKAQGYDPGASTCGVSATSSLASDRTKRGEHRIHVAWQTATTTAAYHLELRKGRRTRGQEESLATMVMLNAVAEACGVDLQLTLPLVEGERVESARVEASAEQQDLLAGSTSAVPLGAARKLGRSTAIFPGAFHPLHAGHRKMASVARTILGQEVAFELSIINVDKPPLDFIEIDQRVRQFTSYEAVWLSRAPTFAKKAELFPGTTFVVGADTIERVGQPRYYGHPAAMDSALAHLATQGCRFLVFGRTIGGQFVTLDDLTLPPALAKLCQGVPEDAFREDISSTQLRKQEAADLAPFS